MNRQRGYVALLAVLITGAIASAIALALLITGIDSQRGSLVTMRSVQARNLATACAEEALQQLWDDSSYTGTGNLSLGQGSCSYTVTNAGGTSRLIATSGTVSAVTRKLQVNATIGSTITITSWQDVGGTPATIAHVQSNGLVDGPSPTSISQSFASNTTSGNVIVAAATWDNSSVTTINCSDNRGNSYNTVNYWNDTTNSQAISICYAPNISGGATTVTVTYGNGSASVAFRKIIISEYSGVATVSPLDVSTGVGGATATTAVDAVTSGSATTSQNGDLIYGLVMDTTSTTTIAAGTGFTQRYSLDNKNFAVQDLQQSVAGSIASTQTFGATHRYDAAMVAFKAQSQ